MAIFAIPAKSRELESRLSKLDELRRYLARHLGESAQPWTGALRRLAAAEATVGSTSIEGYGTSVEAAFEILACGNPPQAAEATHRIIASYGKGTPRGAALADDCEFLWRCARV